MDDTLLCEVSWPALTSVDLGSAERARLAVELLLERIENPELEPRVVGVEPRLVVRASSGSGVVSVAEARGARRSRVRRRSRAGAGVSIREAFLLMIPALLPIVVLSVLPLHARASISRSRTRGPASTSRRTSSGSTTSASC